MRSLLTASTFATAVAIVTLGVAAPVRAADLPEYPPVIDTPEPLPLPAAGGWYLRGDIGYKFYNDPSASLSNSSYAGFDSSNSSLGREHLGNAWDFGAGVGYKVNDYFRTDFTLDYETPGSFRGRLDCPSSCSSGSYSGEFADITAWSGLVNAYADLGTYYGVTPYIGAGVGASYLVTDNVYSNDPDYGHVSHDGDGKWNFAWALMAGASYAIDNHWAVDVGYRYINLGDAQSGIISNDSESTRIDYKNIDAHEVRVGLRYTLF